jgi:hypothetical protein
MVYGVWCMVYDISTCGEEAYDVWCMVYGV